MKCLYVIDDVLSRDAGECVICLEELQQGDTIARLPCLCIYHKRWATKHFSLLLLYLEIIIATIAYWTIF